MLNIQITGAQREIILGNIGKTFDGTNARELQIRSWKPAEGKKRTYINLMIDGGSKASARMIGTEIIIEQGSEFYKSAIHNELVDWLKSIEA